MKSVAIDANVIVRYLTGDDSYDADYWLTRLENLATA